MSTPELTVLPGGKKPLRLVEAYQRTDSDAWVLADAVVEDVRDRLPSLAPALGRDSSHTGLYEVIVDITHEARTAGVDLSTATILDYFRTADAWPSADRVGGVSYKVHKRLYAKPNRKELLGKWVQKHGSVSYEDVERLLSEQAPKLVLSFLDGIEHGVRRLLISRGKPWGSVQQGDRDDIARRLRQIAQEIQHGEGKFGAQ